MTEEHNHNYRTGIGTDIHRTEEGRKLMLGGIKIPASFGLAGHSDGDVVMHSVIDALLGAAGMNDIGTHFPDDAPEYKDADSKGLLLDTKNKLLARNWTVVNVDITIKAEHPKLSNFKGQIKRCVAELLGIDFNAVNVKAKTNEGLGAVGNGEAIESAAVVLLRKKMKRSL